MKSPDAFRTISEAASELGVPQHVLRFWETKFSFIRPMKRAGGRRFYRRQDIEVLRGVRVLLHDEGYTIKGVQRLHKAEGVRRVLSASGAAMDEAVFDEALFNEALIDEPLFDEGDEDAPLRPLLGEAAQRRLTGVLDDLEGVKARLDALIAERVDS